MKIKSLHIENFKSIVDLTIIGPNPFTVFVGANGSGKSNIFEAIEYRLIGYKYDEIVREDLYNNVINFNLISEKKFQYPKIIIDLNDFKIDDIGMISFRSGLRNESDKKGFDFRKSVDYKQFVTNHSNLFLNNKSKEKIPVNSNSKLSSSGSNLEKVLKRVLENDTIREEIFDLMALFIPEFESIEVQKSKFSNNEEVLIYQKYYSKPFTKELISDGTFNIIAILTAIYQSDEPQFICIEEPEIGIHPYIQKELIEFFRNACEERGHYIWLNTHSQSIVQTLKKDEIILVDKKEGKTKIKQLKDFEDYDMKMDDAWLTNFLGGGLPW